MRNDIHLLGLRNIGPTIAARLEAVGITTVGDLRTIGPAKAYKQVKAVHPGKTMPEHVRALAHLSYTHSRKKELATELAYFRSLRHRMRYAEAQAQNLPIGSGVVEAVFKTLATQRMKRSGMHWRPTGGKPF